nr:integrase, catalytic region, zinc finger, CCHC-type, peptidase aspartic, catalytic [Tanacetum cinerariifolium]
MSQDVITVEQTDGEAMINSIQNGDQPLPVIAQVSLAGNAQNAPPTLKDLKFWTAEEKKTRKIDRLARSFLIQGLPNDIYSLIDSNKTAKDLWDALERHMCGSEYAEQDRKVAILYEYETFKSTEGEQLLDTYLPYLQVINHLKKYGYKKDNCELNYKFLNSLQPEWKQYGTLMRQTKNLMGINIDALYNILKQNQGDVNDALGYKKKAIVITSDPLALVAEKTKVSKRKEKVVVSSDSEGSGADDFSELKKITALLAKAFNQRKFYSKPTNNNLRTSYTSQSANKKQEFVKSDDKKEDKKADEKKRDTSKVKCYNCKKEGHFAKDCKKAKVIDYNYYKTKMLLAKKDSDEQVLLAEDQAWMESSSDSDKEINANMVFMAQVEKFLSDSDESSSSAEETIVEIADQDVLFDKMSVHLVELDKNVRDHKNTILEKDFKISELEESKDLRPTLYDEKVISLGYTPMFLTHSDEALEIKKFKRSGENKIKFAYDYRNLNASYVNEKINFTDDYFQEIINPGFDKIDSSFQQTSSLKPYVPNVILDKIIIDLEDEVVSLLEKEKANLETIESLKSKGFESSENAISKSENQSENNCHVVEKESGKVENPNLIAPRMFKLSISQSVSPVSITKTSCTSKNGESKLKRKRHLDTFSSVRRPSHSGVYWKKKGLSNTSNADLSSFFGTVRFGNNDFAVIAGYEDVVIGSMTIKKVYYVEGLGHNLFSVEQFCDNGLEVAFQKSTCFVQNEDGVDLPTGDRSSNLYTIALNEVASNSSTCLLAKASSSQSWLWHQRLSHLNFATINNLVKNNLVQGLPKMKFEKDHLCSACEQGKIHRKHHKSKT